MKTTKTYSIEESIYSAFDSLTSDRNINKSSFIEESIRKFLKDNDMDFIDKLYCLKTNPDHIVTVISQDKVYYNLNDGSKIQKILFMQIFTEIIPVKPEDFFKKSVPIIENIVKKIKNIDETKIPNVSGPNEKLKMDYLEKLSKTDKDLIDSSFFEDHVNKIVEINSCVNPEEFFNTFPLKDFVKKLKNDETHELKIGEYSDSNKISGDPFRIDSEKEEPGEPWEVNPKGEFFNIDSSPFQSENRLKSLIDERYEEEIKDVKNTIIKKIKKENNDELNEMKKQYESGYFINKDRNEICEAIAKLMRIDFGYGEEYQIQQGLIKKLVRLK